MANQIVKDTLHPENEKGVDIYPKTSTDQIEGYAEDKSEINEKIETTKQELTEELGHKIDSSSLAIEASAGTVPVRNSEGNIEVGKATSNREALNEQAANEKYQNFNSEIWDSVDYVCGFTENKSTPRKVPTNLFLSKVTSPIITINALETATNGTITAGDLALLQQNKNSMILFANEYYYLADDQHTSGYLTYSHVGVENGVQWIKSITITVASLSWVKTYDKVGGIRCYKHTIYLQSYTDGVFNGKYINFNIYNNNSEKITNTNQITAEYIRTSIKTEIDLGVVFGDTGLFITNFTLTYIKTIKYFNQDGVLQSYEIPDEYKITDSVNIVSF